MLQRMSRLTAAVALAGLMATPVLAAGVVLGPDVGSVQLMPEGERLLAELNCTACHITGPTLAQRLNSPKAPILGSLEHSPQWIQKWLENPQAMKPGTPMPDVLQGLSSEEKAAAAESLTHYIVSQWPAQEVAPKAGGGEAGESKESKENKNAKDKDSKDAGEAEKLNVAERVKALRGQELYHSVGCVACHAPMSGVGGQAAAGSLADVSIPLGKLASKYSVEVLAAFLQDPVKHHPGGRMPSLKLNSHEAQSLAIYLLRDQLPGLMSLDKPVPVAAGLRHELRKNNASDTWDVLTRPILQAGISDRINTGQFKEKPIAVRFSGLLRVPAPGKWTFFAKANGEARILIDGKTVLFKEAAQQTTQTQAEVQLEAGDRPFEVLYRGQYANLDVDWEGPGISRSRISQKFLWHEKSEMKPVGGGEFKLDPVKAQRGSELFASVGCASCHETKAKPASTLKATAFASLRNLTSGCLADKPVGRAAVYGLSQRQREALRSAAKGLVADAKPLEPAAQLAHALVQHNCVACHTRDGQGGPQGERNPQFKLVGEADLGDEGRLPPTLTKVGGKLRTDAIDKILLQGWSVRPYMATRMPQFGSRVSKLPALFERVDATGNTGPAAPEGTALLTNGHKLAGVNGLSCVSCHTFADKPSLGIPAVDLAQSAKRLRYSWFHAYLLDPVSLRPGTRMPQFWPGGKAVRSDILQGDTEQQIAALWVYLQNHERQGLPEGLVRAMLELAASSTEARMYRGFIEGAPRSIAVAYPEKVNLSYDAEFFRPVWLWQGPFLDVSKQREGRGAVVIAPLGFNVLRVYGGVPLAVLPAADAPWPDAAPASLGYQFRGYELDSQRRPTFHFEFQGIKVSDRFDPVATDKAGVIKRTLTLQGTSPQGTMLRVALGKVERQADGSFKVDGRYTLSVKGGGEAVIASVQGKTELRVPILLSGDKVQIVEEITW